MYKILIQEWKLFQCYIRAIYTFQCQNCAHPSDHDQTNTCGCSFHLLLNATVAYSPHTIFWSTKKIDSLWRIFKSNVPKSRERICFSYQKWLPPKHLSPIKDEDWMNHKDYHHQSRISKMAINSVSRSVAFSQYNVGVKCYLTRTKSI